jgi:hypothetical protein
MLKSPTEHESNPVIAGGPGGPLASQQLCGRRGSLLFLAISLAGQSSQSGTQSLSAYIQLLVTCVTGCCMGAGCAAGIMHGYFLKLLGSYRSHIYPEGAGPGFAPAGPPAYSSPAAPPATSRSPGHQRSRSALPLHGAPSSSALAALAADSKQGPRNVVSSPSGSRRQSRASSSSVGPVADEGMKAHGFCFDHAGLVAAHKYG